jgi:aspartyl-tRNA(Asn)/glutamyl-tRNA(Gln) amidotransferase subunit A
MFRLTIKQANEKLKSWEISSADLTKAHFERIKKIDPEIKAYITLLEEQAIDKADAIDKSWDFSSPLTWIPYAMKDLICMKWVKTTAGSKILENFIPPYDSTIASKLNMAVCLWKVNLDEFAMWSSTENSAFFNTHNPWDLKRVPWWSSGWSAASVAGDEAIFAIWTDTWWSIRQPAAFCGCVWLKVSYWRVSRSWVIAYASSFDTIGPLTKTVEDAAIVLNHIAGQDPKDSTTPNVKVDDYTLNLNNDLKWKHIAYIKEFMEADWFDPKLKEKTQETLWILEKLWCEINEISIPEFKHAIETYYLLTMSEASSNLSRYDGIRYWHQASWAKELKDVYINSRSEGFWAEPKRKIMLGTFALSAWYIDAYYKKAAKVRNLIKQGFEKALSKNSAILAPVTPTTAFEMWKNSDDPLKMYLEDIFTGPVNLAWVPWLSIPIWLVDWLPVWAQIIWKQFDESW